jgi:hypothetical protein
MRSAGIFVRHQARLEQQVRQRIGSLDGGPSAFAEHEREHFGIAR